MATQYITPEDKFILSSERNPLENCYAPPHPLSTTENLFNNKTILQWMIIAAPKHPFLENTLTHSVAVVKMFYKKQPVLVETAVAPFMPMICATGPVLYANAIRQVVQKYKKEGRVKELGYRYAGFDFEEIGGKYKAAGFQWNSKPGYYQNQMKKMGVQLLKSYES
jgi:hypothetical protein